MSQMIDVFKQEYDKAISHYKDEIDKLRAGKAIPAMIEDVLVESYGTKTPIKQLASISVPESTMLVVEPWDKSILKDIERGLSKANLDMSISVSDNVVRVQVQAPTEDKRKALVKILHDKREDARVSIRQIRDRARKDIEQREQNKEIGEDDKFDLFKKIDDMTKEQNQLIEEMTNKKEKEIMTV